MDWKPTLKRLAHRLRRGGRPGLLILALLAGHWPVYGQARSADAGFAVYAPLVARATSTDPSACQLPEAAFRGDVGLGFPRLANRMTSTGVARAVVLFVDFADAAASETPAQMFARIAPQAVDFYTAVSYGRLTYQLEPHLAWLRMSQPSTNYGWNGWASLTFNQLRAYMQEAVSLADPAVDFTGVQAVYVMASLNATAISYGPALAASPGFGLTADGREILNGAVSGTDLLSWGALWLNHEAGHTLGLVDLYAFTGSPQHRFVGGFSMMGLISGLAPEYLAYERWLLGWLDSAQIYCLGAGAQTVQLTALELAGGLKAVMVPTGPTSAVVVESRRALGYDTGLPKAGALVYTVDTSITSGSGPVKVLPDLADKYQSPLALTDSLTVGAVTIQVLQTTATTDLIQVTVAP